MFITFSSPQGIRFSLFAQRYLYALSLYTNHVSAPKNDFLSIHLKHYRCALTLDTLSIYRYLAILPRGPCILVLTYTLFQ